MAARQAQVDHLGIGEVRAFLKEALLEADGYSDGCALNVEQAGDAGACHAECRPSAGCSFYTSGEQTREELATECPAVFIQRKIDNATRGERLGYGSFGW
ncbi:hypothetical protein GCM10027589_17280 [Actinocorallia lasiicapitis]